MPLHQLEALHRQDILPNELPAMEFSRTVQQCSDMPVPNGVQQTLAQCPASKQSPPPKDMRQAATSANCAYRSTSQVGPLGGRCC